MAFVSVNSRGTITAVSDRRFTGAGETFKINTSLANGKALLGKRLIRDHGGLKVAMISNWGQECGISTYAAYLEKALRPVVKSFKIFSEEGIEPSENIIPCWKRGQSMTKCMTLLKEYNPDFVLIQHEFGIFPKAPYLLQMLQALDSFPYAVILHSTYEHLDKSICTSAMKNIIVHTDTAKNILKTLGNSSEVSVIPHGCAQFPDRQELWNIFQTPYAIVQFGFGFFYKGVDRAIDALHILKKKNPDKYHNIFYCYLCSENPHTKNIHNEYQDFLVKKIDSLGLKDNVAIVKKWNTDQEINNYLRTAKLAIFPYLINPGNVVYGASGALRIAFANGIPCIASESHLFDEVPGLPRPTDAESLANEIDNVFSNSNYKSKLIVNQDHYVENNTWDITADRYLQVMKHIRSNDVVVV